MLRWSIGIIYAKRFLQKVAYFCPTLTFLVMIMGKEKVQMPSSTAGITRYFEDYKSKIQFTPGSLIVIVIIVIVLMILLHTYGSAMFGVR